MKRFLWFILIFLCSVYPPAQAASVEGAALMEVIDPESEKGMSLHKSVQLLVQSEIELFGSFEVDDPDTGEYYELMLDQIRGDTARISEDEYVVRALFFDAEEKPYRVDIFLLEFNVGDYEIVDAVIVKATSSAPV